MNQRRTFITTALILAVAVAGLMLIDVGNTDAVGQSAAKSVKPASENTGETVNPALTGMDDGMMAAMGKMAAALVVVVIAIYGAVWGLKRLNGGRRRGRNGRQLLEVVETAYLAPKKSVALVRVADKAVVVGVTDGQMSVLTELDSDQAALALADQPNPDNEADRGFDRMFASAANRLRRFAAKPQTMAAAGE